MGLLLDIWYKYLSKKLGEKCLSDNGISLIRRMIHTYTTYRL